MARPRVLAWARLLRISLFPSALADPIAGASVVGLTATAAPALGLAIAASLCVFHGAMAINDWHDLDQDRAAGRTRPLPEGSIPPAHACGAGAALMLFGVLLAFLLPSSNPAQETLSPWIVLAGVASVAAAYNLGLRGPFLGPTLLGLCRAGNFLFGATLVLPLEAGTSLAIAIIGAAFYFCLVFLVSVLGRYEDGEAAATEAELGLLVPRLLRAQAVLLLALPPALVLAELWTSSGRATQTWTYLALGLSIWLAAVFAMPLWRSSKSRDWDSAKVEAIMGLCLSRFVPFSILVIVASSSGIGALLLATCLFGLAKFGRRLMAVIPPS